MTASWMPVRAILSGRHEGQAVQLRGWVYRHRTSGGIVFCTVRDSTGVVQCTIRKGSVPDAAFEQAKEANNEASVVLQGTVHKDPRAPGGWEVKAADFRLVGKSPDFPITEYQSTELLLDKRHLWLRSRKLTNMMRVKAVMLRGFREWFDAQGFWETTPSVITTNACEGGSTLFAFDYFGQKAFLSQSSQMYLEALMFSLGNVWCLTPSFRAEKSRTTKHLTEFSHLEAEEAWVDYQGNMDIQEQLVSHVAQKVARECEAELVELGREPAQLRKVQGPFKRITYEDALDLLRKKGFEMAYGDDFGQPHERALMEGEEEPVFITLWPEQIKAFYMALSDDGKKALCADLLAPEGYGEIVGGSQRSEDIGGMKARLAREDPDTAPYEWYFDLRRYGSVPHSGFGLGTERVLAWLTKAEHIRDATPFPRTINRAYP
jgi:asparaginyl-tRNA synthetase